MLPPALMFAGLKLTTTVVALAAALFVFLWWLGWLPGQRGPFVYCVIGTSDSDFIGEGVRHRRALFAQPLLTEECLLSDRQIDDGDGHRSGRVRWVACGERCGG